MVYSAVLAHGTSLSAADISRMVPEVSPAAIRQMMKRLEDERMLRLAADAVLEFMHEHPVAACWGRAALPGLGSPNRKNAPKSRAHHQAALDKGLPDGTDAPR